MVLLSDCHGDIDCCTAGATGVMLKSNASGVTERLLRYYRVSVGMLQSDDYGVTE
jgi:hypothetical protein